MFNSFNFMFNAVFILFLVITLKYSYAWNKTHFYIDSKFSKECGHSKEYSPENYFEYWGFWPWLGMAFYDGFGRGTRCNAVLIHTQAVISSLHCFKHIPEIKLEEHLFIAFSLPGLPSFQNISVSEIDFTGDHFNTGSSMAILKLSKPVIVSAQVQPICLWEEDHDYSHQLKSHIGLMVGADLNNLYEYSNLRAYQAPVHIISSDACKKTHSHLYNTSTEEPLCYNYYRTPVNCHGFGSLLMFPRLSESGAIVWYLRSIVTLRKWNCDDGSYTPSFDVGDSRKWLESHFRPSTETKCGRRIGSHIPLVTIGQRTDRGDWPWHAALFKDNNDKTERKYRCGGSLISESYVLTAGHCVHSGDVLLSEKLSVKLGKFQLNVDEQDSLDIRVDEIIPHELYNSQTLRNDIALLLLASNVTFNQYIQPICLWYNGDLDKSKVYNEIGRVPGWGLNEQNNYPDNLYMATIPIVDDIYCHQSHATFYDTFLSNLTLCAGNPRGNGSGVCNGDSGGGLVLPVTQDDREATWYLRGIVSVTVRRNNRKICDPDYYAIYTDVAKYLDWIKFQTSVFD